MWFGYAGGGHAILRAFHAGDRFFAANWPAEKRNAFLDWAGRQGYNTLSIASHYLNRNAPGRGQGWETPKLWPLDAAEYRRMEAALDERPLGCERGCDRRSGGGHFFSLVRDAALVASSALAAGSGAGGGGVNGGCSRNRFRSSSASGVARKSMSERT